MAIVYDTVVTAEGNGVNSDTFASLTTAEANEGLTGFFHFSNADQSGVTFSGGTGLSWTKIGTEITIPTSGGEVYSYHALAASIQSAVTITATYTGANFPQATAVLMAFKGVKNTDTFIGATTTASSGSSTNLSTSITTTQNGSLVISGTGQTANIAMSAGSGQTEAAETTAAPGTVSRCNGQYQNAVTTNSGTSVTANTTTGSNAPMGLWVIELLAAPVAPHRQSGSSGANASTTPQHTLSSTPIQGNLLVAGVALGNTSGGFTAINGYTEVAGPNNQASYFYKIAGAGESATQAPCTTVTARDYRCAIAEYTANSLTFSLDASGATADATSPQDQAAINPTDNVNAIMVGIATNDVARTYTAQTIGAITAVERVDASQNSNAAVTLFDRVDIYTSTSTFAAQATASGVPSNGTIALLIFKGVAAAGGSQKNFLTLLGAGA